MALMTQDWDRLVATVEAAMAARGWRQKDLIVATGVSRSTIQRLMERHQPVSASTLRHLERALGWTAGSCDTVLGGGEPKPLARADVDGGTVSIEAMRIEVPGGVEHVDPIDPEQGLIAGLAAGITRVKPGQRLILKRLIDAMIAENESQGSDTE